MSAGHYTIYQPPTPMEHRYLHCPLAAPGLSQTPWTPEKHTHNSQQTPIWQNAGEEAVYTVVLTLRDKQNTFTHIPQGQASALLHFLVLGKCLNDDILRTKKRNCLT